MPIATGPHFRLRVVLCSLDCQAECPAIRDNNAGVYGLTLPCKTQTTGQCDYKPNVWSLDDRCRYLSVDINKPSLHCSAQCLKHLARRLFSVCRQMAVQEVAHNTWPRQPGPSRPQLPDIALWETQGSRKTSIRQIHILLV